MTPKLSGLFQKRADLLAAIGDAIRTEFPLGARVRYERGGNNRVGTIQAHLYDCRIRVLNERTGNCTDIEIGLYTDIDRL